MLFVSFDVSQRLLVHILRERPGFNLTLDLLWRGNHFGLGLGQIEGLELRAFRFLLLLSAIGHQLGHSRVMCRHRGLSETTHCGVLVRAH